MEFRILGALEVTDDGRRLELGGAKQRALLAMLLLHANEVVSTDRLIDALWEEEAPEGARKTLQVYVSGLRKALGKDRLETQAPGYTLRVADGELDLTRVERLAAEGRFGEALALWRGPCLQEFAYQRFAAGEIERIEELRLGCVEARIDAELADGRHSALVGDLERLVRENPLRERLRGQLMLALYRSGRQAEALEAYAAARRALVDELGIEPSRELRELEGAILRQDPALELEPRAEPEEAAAPPVRSHAAPRPADRAERKTVTAMYVRLGMTAEGGGDVDPEVLQDALGRAMAEIEAAVAAHQGTVDARAADALTAIFGIPVVHEDDPARAARAAEEARARLQALAGDLRETGVLLETGIGLSTGQVMTGGALRATGEPLTRAAALAHEAEPFGIALDERTRRSASTTRDATRFASPMVGRERERRRLHDTFEQALSDRSCQLFTILGAAGVGKSRLVREFLGEIGNRALVARGRCLPYGDGITFWPLLEAIKELGGLEDPVSVDDVQASLTALVEGEPGGEEVVRSVSELAGLGESAASVEDGFEALRSYLELAAAARPVVVVFDDVHWGEERFLDLVEHLAEWSRGVPLLLVCVARPELLDIRPSWSGGKLNATSILLEPLTEGQTTELVANLVGEATLGGGVSERIAGAAEGNPLFVEEVVSMLIDDGILVREDGRWAATSDLAEVPMPPTIQALLAARLDQLTFDERSAIEAAAVEGMVFHASSVASLLGRDDAATATALASVVRKELVRPDRGVFAGERGFRFRHLMIRDAAYESLPKGSRARLHALHAAWLEERIGDRSVEFDEILGYHLEQSWRYRAELGAVHEETRELGRRAAERLGGAGRRAFARSDAPAGLNLVSRAVSLLTPDDPLRVDLVPNVRVVQGMQDLDWADRVLTEAVEAAATSGDRRLAAHALVQRGLLRLFTASDVTTQELTQSAEQTIKVFEELDDDLGLARAWRLVAQAHYLGRSGAASAEASERALTHARAAADRFEQHEIVEWLVIALLLGPAHGKDAIARCERLLEETAGDPHLEAQILGALAPLLAMQRRAAEADAAMERGSRVMDEAGEPIWVVSFWRAMVHIWRGDEVAAEQELRPSYEALKRIGEKSHFSSLAHGLANSLYMQGRYGEAEELTYECEEACRPNDVHSHVFWRSVRAKVFARRGRFAEALELAHDAVELAEESDFLPARAGALEDVAKVLYMAGRIDEARPALEAAIDRYEQKGNLLAVDRARRLLADRTG
jgi:DNA-binding SARP family transcriptional activator/tetratricopeptide (TPR) repeat protein